MQESAMKGKMGMLRAQADNIMINRAKELVLTAGLQGGYNFPSHIA